MGIFKKVFITGEIDLYDVLFQNKKANKIAKRAESGLLSFADLATKKISNRVADIKTDLYLSGVIDTMPKITMEQIAKADIVVENNPLPVSSSRSEENNIKESIIEEQFDNSQNTTVQRRENSKPRTNTKSKMLSRKYEHHETMRYLNRLTPSSLEYILGHDEKNNLIIQDLEKEPHVVIAGKTGSGKTVTTFNMLVSFAFNNTPDTLRFSLIDLKLLTFGDSRIANSVFLHGVPPALDAESALDLLRKAHADMLDRYKKMMQLGVKDYKDANLHHHVIVIDEVAELLDMGERKLSIEALKLISSIASMGRQGGVFLVMATQSPSAELLSGKLKTNLNNIGHLVSNSDQAKILGLTDKENNPNLVRANYLNGNGDGLKILNGHNTPTRFQATFIELKDHSSYQFF